MMLHMLIFNSKLSHSNSQTHLAQLRARSTEGRAPQHRAILKHQSAPEFSRDGWVCEPSSFELPAPGRLMVAPMRPQRGCWCWWCCCGCRPNSWRRWEGLHEGHPSTADAQTTRWTCRHH
eukprot:1151205-Pelagomonas_calceolata.AAC.2